MKALKTILAIVMVIGSVCLFVNVYTSRIEKIESGEMTLVSESYMDR